MSYESLLELALTSHDPFRAAFKEQYASLVLTHGAEQLAVARAVAARLEVARGRKLATRIEPLKRFTDAEDYHQKYVLRNDRVLFADFRAMFGSDENALRKSTAAARVNGYLAGDGTRAQLSREIESLGLGEQGRARLIAKAKDGGIAPACSL